MRKTKTPNGKLYREVRATTQAIFDNAEIVDLLSNMEDVDYTGRFYFEFENGSTTRWYTYNTAPNWLVNYYERCQDEQVL